MCVYYSMLLLCYLYAPISWHVLIIGIAVTRATIGSSTITSANAINEYSYVYATNDSIMATGIQIAHCITGLGPGVDEDNSALGGLYFNGSRLPFGQCDDSSSIVLPRVGGLNNSGVIDVIQCREFSAAAEGIYTCVMMNSSLINETFRFGVYFTGRSKSLI